MLFGVSGLLLLLLLDSWDLGGGRWGGRSLRWTSSETEAWDGPLGASFAGGKLGSLPLPPLGCLSSRSCRPVRSGYRTVEHSRGCEELDFQVI